MKQVIQSLKTGITEVVRLPTPSIKPGQLLIQTSRTLISAGTERMLIDFGRAGLIDKARQQPEKVREVLDKIRADGIASTLEAVQAKLDEPLGLGYSNVGIVREVGAGVKGFSPGDRVASNGSHAERVVVPQNLCTLIPNSVSDDEAAFTVAGSVALQGVRLAAPTLGEAFVVMGLGLIGLMTVQLLRAHGCRVLGVDLDSMRAELARSFGAETVYLEQGEDPVEMAKEFSRGRGVDGVLLTLDSSSDEPISQAAHMCRKRGRIVLVGVTGLKLNRADFYEKELSFQVSSSYGPGRYDPVYEQEGQDYPLGFVRWTAQRNFEAVLDMMAAGSLDVKPLISHRFALEDAPRAYDLLAEEKEPYLGILLEYSPTTDSNDRTVTLTKESRDKKSESPPSYSGNGKKPVGPGLAVIGAGNYAGRVLIPALRRTQAQLITLANRGGVSGVHQGQRYGFKKLTTDPKGLMQDKGIDAVVIATRHDSHANLTRRALEAHKHVFCEKPLALTLPELEQIRDTLGDSSRHSPILMVGFNRRFAPLVARMKQLLEPMREPKTFLMTMNAGKIAPDHWTQDPSVGGGRLIGEACHFIDLMRHLAGAPISGWDVKTIGPGPGIDVRDDKAVITLTFEDGSFGTIHYLANGHKSFPKERIEVFCAERILQLDNFRRLRAYGWPGFRGMRQWRQDKGHNNCVQAFVDAVKDGGPPPIPPEELMEVSRITIEIGEAARG